MTYRDECGDCRAVECDGSCVGATPTTTAQAVEPSTAQPLRRTRADVEVLMLEEVIKMAPEDTQEARVELGRGLAADLDAAPDLLDLLMRADDALFEEVRRFMRQEMARLMARDVERYMLTTNGRSVSNVDRH